MTTSSSHCTCILFADYSISSIDFAVGTPCQRIELKWRWMTYPHSFPSLLVRTLLWEFHGYWIFFPFFALDIEWAGFHRACNFWNCCYCYRIDSYHHGLLLLTRWWLGWTLCDTDYIELPYWIFLNSDCVTDRIWKQFLWDAIQHAHTAFLCVPLRCRAVWRCIDLPTDSSDAM